MLEGQISHIRRFFVILLSLTAFFLILAGITHDTADIIPEASAASFSPTKR